MRRGMPGLVCGLCQAGAFGAAMLSACGAAAAQDAAIALAPGERVIAEYQAAGAQIYQCRIDSAGESRWLFREPIATLLQDERTVGRHYAGPTWELVDGSLVKGRVTGKAPGAVPADIPLLKLAVSSNGGKGELAAATAIQRIDTSGGALEGTCDKPGEFRSVAYTARYVFLTKD